MSLCMAIASAFWLGILTSMSPCPLASNVAAISYLVRETESPRSVVLSGLLYSAGRAITYVGLGVLIAGSLLSIPDVAFFLQTRMNQVLGPVLILAGLVLLGGIRGGFKEFVPSEEAVSRLKALGNAGALLLGMLFALSFCPVSAGLFFGSLIPLALQQDASFSLSLAYGVGTAFPVLAIAMGIALGVKGLGKFLNRAKFAGNMMRKLAGWVFLLIGFYYLLSHVFVPLFARAP